MPVTPSSRYPGPFQWRFLHPRYLGAWLTVMFIALAGLMPDRLRLSLAARVGDLMYRRNRKRRAIVETNLRWCFPELAPPRREAIARGFFREFVACQLDYGLLWWGRGRTIDRRVRIEGEEHLAPLLDAGRPVILLACHHVAVDFAGIAINRRYPALSMFKRLRDPVLDWFVARGRARQGGLLYERHDHLKSLVRQVRQGHLFYYMPDEDLGPDKSVFAPFFGVPAATLTSLAKLARLCDAAVVPYMGYHRQGRYTARLFPALDGFPHGDAARDAARMNAALERMIREAPDQYVWSLRLFQTRPHGAPSPYTRHAAKSSPSKEPAALGSGSNIPRGC